MKTKFENSAQRYGFWPGDGIALGCLLAAMFIGIAGYRYYANQSQTAVDIHADQQSDATVEGNDQPVPESTRASYREAERTAEMPDSDSSESETAAKAKQQIEHQRKPKPSAQASLDAFEELSDQEFEQQLAAARQKVVDAELHLYISVDDLTPDLIGKITRYFIVTRHGDELIGETDQFVLLPNKQTRPLNTEEIPMGVLFCSLSDQAVPDFVMQAQQRRWGTGCYANNHLYLNREAELSIFRLLNSQATTRGEAFLVELVNKNDEVMILLRKMSNNETLPASQGDRT